MLAEEIARQPPLDLFLSKYKLLDYIYRWEQTQDETLRYLWSRQ